MMTICSLPDLPDPGTYEFSIGDGDWPLRGFVVLFRGELRAYMNSCPHAGLPLNFRPNVFFAPHVELLQCAAHGALFEPLSGQCVQGPCPGLALRELAVQVCEGKICLSALSMIDDGYRV